MMDETHFSGWEAEMVLRKDKFLTVEVCSMCGGILCLDSVQNIKVSFNSFKFFKEDEFPYS